MKLKTEKGELSLPTDFSFTIEETNPFFSDEGDASIPATIPASSENLKVLGHIERIDNYEPKANKVEAVLQCGHVQKRGQLIIDTVRLHDGISVSLAVANSDLYSQHKEKTLKEIFASKRKSYQNVFTCVHHLLRVMSGEESDDFAIFPVAVAKYEDADGNEIMQYNNEIDMTSQSTHSALVWQSRTVYEDDMEMEVPEGYGVSPFIYLHRMITLMFELLGYSVEYNCFERDELKDIVLVNNNSDTIADGNIDYKDLVPSCTLSDFLQFLTDKFCCNVRVDSSTSKVWVLLMRDMLQQSTYDIDLTMKIVGDMEVGLNNSSRVVLSSQTSLENSTPAMETLDKLMQKYKYFHMVNELQFASLTSILPTHYDCIVQRKATGEFYELCRDLVTGEQIIRRIGTNHFAYNRYNSDDTEQHQSKDELCPVSHNQKLTSDDFPQYYMYIGERINAKTSYNSQSETDEQGLILAWANRVQYKCATYGTQQRYDNLGQYEIHDFALTPQDMYDYFWSDYNNLLLNNKVELSAELLLSSKEIEEYSMVTPKLINGQKAIPVQLSYEVGNRTRPSSATFILAKNFNAGLSDQPIANNPEDKRLRWLIVMDSIKTMAQSLYSQLSVIGIYVKKQDGSHYVPDPWPADPAHTYYTDYTTLLLPNGNYEIELIETGEPTYIGPPDYEGQVAMKYVMHFKLVVSYDVYNVNLATGYYNPSSSTRNVTYEDDSYKGEVYFVAEAY